MGRWARKLAVVFATGFILFFWSERVFWSFFRPGDRVSDWLLTWAVYSLLAWIFLLVIKRFRVGGFWAVFLAGAIYGWLAEGVVVDTMYGSKDNPFPISISFTGLAWHALISVGLGWFWLGRMLCTGSSKRVAMVSAAMGLAWGLWAGWWPAELGWPQASLGVFAGHTVLAYAGFVGAWAVLGRSRPDWFQPARWELAVLGTLAALFFFGVRVPATPRSVLILPPLLLVCLYALHRSAAHARAGRDAVDGLLGAIRPRNLLMLSLMPLTALAVYTPFALTQTLLPTNWVVYVLATPLGFLLLGWSLRAAFRRGHTPSWE